MERVPKPNIPNAGQQKTVHEVTYKPGQTGMQDEEPDEISGMEAAAKPVRRGRTRKARGRRAKRTMAAGAKRGRGKAKSRTRKAGARASRGKAGARGRARKRRSRSRRRAGA
ncbi:MAG: hypothetical protein ACT4OG_10520 [Alphaproteobacteria bacterium]